MEIRNGRLGYTQDLDNQKFLNALRQSNRGVTDFNAHLQQNFNQSLISVNDLAKGVTAFLTIDMARDFVTQMVKIRGEFEQTEIAFNTMLQSREKGNALMKEMVELAKNTPMQFSEVSKGAKQLLAYQVEAEKLTGTLSMLGDISSGLGVPISRLILVYGQVRAKGRLMGDDLRQFTEAGVPMIAMIAKNMGIAESAVADMVSAGKVGFKDVEKVLEQLTSQGGLFFNMMEEQSKTIPGQIAKLEDEIEQMFNSIGKDSQGFVSDVIGGASTVVENYKEIGNVLGTLIATYGAYKAALFLVSIAESTHIKNSAIVNGSKLNDLRTTLQETEANLVLAKSEDAVALSKLESVQAGISAQAVKRQEALASLNAAHAAKVQAEAEVAAATVKYNALKGSHFIKRERLALQELEIAQTNLATQTQNVNSASIAYNTEVTKAQTLSKEAQILTTEKSITSKAVENTQEAVNIVNKNINDVATKRLTLSQHYYALTTRTAAAWQAFLNATMLNNPIVAVTVAVGGLIAAYFLLRDTTTAAEKAQESYNKTQEDVKSKVDETKQKAEEYINVLKDETATVYQQLQAYKALQLLKLKGIENLTQEQIATMDLTELRKLLNAAYDDQSLESQRQKLSEIGNEIDVVQKKLDEHNKTLSKGDINTGVLQNKVDELTLSYDLQLAKVKEIEKEQYLANLPLRDRAKYWEDEVNRIQNTINEIENTNTKHTETKSLLGSNVELSTIFKTTLNSVNITPLLSELEEAKKQFSAINAEMGGSALIPEVKNKAYWEKQKNDASASRDALGVDKKGTKEWVELTKRIDEANNALQAYNDTYKKPPKAPKPKTPKKPKDPVEVYKKQVSEIEKQYEQYLKILDSNDVTFATEKAILKAQLSSKGASYEEYLRSQQKELIKTAKTSDVARKKLLLINEELLKLSKHSELQIFKEDFEKQLDDLDSVIEKLYEVQDLKESLRGKSDPLSIKKIEFIDEKQKELLKDSENAARSLFKTLTDESKPLDAINKKFDNELLILKSKILNANEEISKLTISAKSSPEGSNERIKVEERILKLKKEILDTQNLIDFNEKKRAKEVKENPTNNADYNLLLKNYQDFNAQKKTIEDEFENNLKTVREERVKIQNNKELQADQSKLDQMLAQSIATENEIERQKKKSLSKIALEQMKSSESYMKLMTKDLDKMTIESLEKIIKDLEQMQKDPNMGLLLNEEDFKVIIDQIRKVKDEVNKAKPWKGISEGWDKLFNGKDSEDKLEGVGMLIDGMNNYFDTLKQAIDMADQAIEAFGGNIDDSVKETIQSVQNIVNGVGNAIQGYFSGDYVKMVAGIVQVVVEVAKILGGSKDKRLEKRIKKQQEAVKELKRAYDELSFSIERALGGKEYSMQKDQIKNLEEQKVLMEQMIKNEEKKKKTDRNKINEWKDAISSIDRQIIETQENIANDILQTSAKELASTLGDALAEAFGKGEDAAKSFEKVANDVLKNAVLNQLKKRFIEEELKKALDQLEKDMGVDEKGWNGLSPEEQQDFRDRIKEISQNFQGALEQYSDLFKDLTDPNETAMAGAIKGMSEETGNALLGQFNAIRILQKELVTINIDSNKILLNSLDRLANIDYNTRSVLPLLEKLINRIDNAGRAYGF